jgi:hypothetical protein
MAPKDELRDKWKATCMFYLYMMAPHTAASYGGESATW